MSPSVDHLSKARMRQLLAAVGSAPAPEPPVGDVAPYDWRDPHYLNANQLNRLAAIMSQTAARLADVFSRFFNREFDVSPTAITQHFAGDLRRFFDPTKHYCLAFGPDKGPSCGFFAISSQTTAGWVSWLLGDADTTGDPNRTLSSLEESLLSDLVAAALEAFLAPLRPHEALKGSGQLNKGQPAVQFERTNEICRIAFQIKEPGKEEPSDLTFVLSCGKLAALVGKTPAAASQATPQELSSILMEHVQQMPVTVTARLASTEVGFQDIMDLGPGDVLLLDKPVQETIELAVEGCVAFRGRPTRCGGQYAIFIQEAQAGRSAEPPKPKTSGEPKKG
ncbi:MAG: FliM/FliN family flagellar motor switch protein [Phycisphaerales bacterium]